MPTTHRLLLVPGYWLGAWAWDDVVARLGERGIVARAVTLPGLDGSVADARDVSLADQVAFVADQVRSAGEPVVLVGHSGAGEIITGAADAEPGAVAALVFVDSGPAADGHVASPDLPADVVELALPAWDGLEAAGSSLAGLDDSALTSFRSRAVPHPARPAREVLTLRDPARYAIPVTVVCCSLPAEEVRALAAQRHPWFEELTRFADVRYVDLPTGHWPMWSRPDELASVLAAAS